MPTERIFSGSSSFDYERVELSSIRELGSGAYIIRFPGKHVFLPGQMVGLTTDPGIKARYYSIASGTGEPYIEILFTRVDEGELTPRLSDAKPGDTLWVSAPSGSFTEREGLSWWIAAGTGVAPFASMVRSGFHNGKFLIHGGRSPESFYYSDLFREALGDRYVRCSSTGAGEGVYPGRLTSWLAERESFPGDTHFYLCGSNAMVVDVRDLLLEKGVRYDRIISEIYF